MIGGSLLQLVPFFKKQLDIGANSISANAIDFTFCDSCEIISVLRGKLTGRILNVIMSKTVASNAAPFVVLTLCSVRSVSN